MRSAARIRSRSTGCSRSRPSSERVSDGSSPPVNRERTSTENIGHGLLAPYAFAAVSRAASESSPHSLTPAVQPMINARNQQIIDQRGRDGWRRSLA
jgi:hypothetical protein